MTASNFDFSKGSTLENKKVRESIVDGIFYPRTGEELRAKISRLADTSKVQPGNAAAVMIPHAGYNYTGALAADAFLSCSCRKISTAVIIAPVTRDAKDGIFLSSYDAFRTPLGEIPVATEYAGKLLGQKGRFMTDDFPFMEEHSIEVQLPFIQHFFPDASILPIHMGKQNAGTVKQLVKGLRTVFSTTDPVLFIVSGNISPYLQKDLAAEYAENFISLAKNADYTLFIENLMSKTLLPNSTGCFATLLGLYDSRPDIKILGTADSGGEKTVNYTAIALYH
ncbi:MAG: AmmeMemoRadiSam system protein B [Spirochaetia bacterium]|nr:AmmeMemoRadiSam system protein B [Spirochaetia bacterium]